ncbi:hypothetical protein B0T26DRAFT_803721 [Lasiosphaeria miniovina]|uniref:Uncharacterized protein n=1 Tax=Lasiosphaeria miniovina TaxID=1954250 RepID=A0AA40ABG4_9PEZI|nr:uncharacterized protein B0T26DRAFT_803721 [Lasiosphaeria miniovina]KAK0712719.1 hypothetical protein B0T26DRAFT_803721 [Lasiosphaeria miniovina]
MGLALEKLLGGPVCHSSTQLLGREDTYPRNWFTVYTAQPQNNRTTLLPALREATAGFVAPSAAAVCWRRDPDRWWARVWAVIGKTMPPWLNWFLAPVPGWQWFPGVMAQMSRRFALSSVLSCEADGVVVWVGVSSGREMLVESGHPQVPLRLRQASRPPERLHWVELASGWAPLRAVLNKPVPDVSFPRANDAAAVEATARDIFRKTAMVWAVIVAVTTVLLGGLGRWTGAVGVLVKW